MLVGTYSMANSYECRFTEKVSYSGHTDKTPNKTQKVNMRVIYRVSGNDLLTRPAGTNTTYPARFTSKHLDRKGDLYYFFRSSTGYFYALSEDMSEAIEVTPSGKTVLHAYCTPIY